MSVSRLERQLSHLKAGDHLCQIHETIDEQYAVAARVIADGLARGDRCLFVVDDLSVEEARARLAAAGIDVAGAMKRDALRLLTPRETYLKSGRFEPQEMIDRLAEEEGSALLAGHAGVRLLGGMGWALDEHVEDRLLRYEPLLNEHLARSEGAIVLCQYRRDRFDTAVLYDVLRTHPTAIIRKTVCSNPYYEPPELARDADPSPSVESRRRRAEWWMTQLCSARSAKDGQARALATLKDRELLIRLLLESTVEAICGIDLEGKCTFINPACARLLGYADPRELEGKDMHALVHHRKPDGSPYPSEECPIVVGLKRGKGVHRDDESFWRADGTSFPVEYWSYPVMRKGELIGAVVTFLDVSERKTLEEQLRQSQKMEALGQLAGGVAHDFNNHLTVIFGFTELLMQPLSEDDPRRMSLAEIRRAAQRSASLTRQLLAFSRKQVLAPRVINLNETIRVTEQMLRRVIGEDVKLETSLPLRLHSIQADPNQLEQVLLNLAVNARDAMPQGGTLTIRTENVLVDEEFARTRVGLKPGPHVRLTVTDTGIGMTDDVMRRVWEPFFTTKAPGKGTGLGLPVVHGIIRQSDGYIDVESRPGAGTSFLMYFPRVTGAIAAPRSSAELSLAPHGSETLLLVEDDSAVRQMMRQVLESCGYSVLEAAGGDEAIQKYAKFGKPVDILITDVVMPDLGGRHVAERLQAVQPGLRVLYVSGYTDDAVIRHGIAQDHAPFLEKPFTPVALAEKVREVLDSSPWHA